MTKSFTRMSKSFTTATAVAAALAALGSAAWAGPAPVQLAQMNAAPKIQPAPPPNLGRTPVIVPKIDMSRLAGEADEDETEKETNANPEQIPQETATGGANAPELARQSPQAPAAARLTRAPLPEARPDLFGGIDPGDLIDARGAAEAREAAEAAATAGVGVERSNLSGLGDPMAGDGGGGPDPQVGGMSPDEYKERFGLGGMKSPAEIAAGMATEFNNLGNRGTSSPTGDFAAGFRPDPSNIPRGDLAANKPYTGPDGEVRHTLPQEGEYVEDSGWQNVPGHPGYQIRHVDKHQADGSTVSVTLGRMPSGHTTRSVTDSGSDGEVTSQSFTVRDSDGNEVYHERTARRDDGTVVTETRGESPTIVPTDGGVAELHTREGAPGGIGGCAPSDGSAACQEWRRLMREGNSPGRIMAGATRVNPGDPDDGATGDGPRIWMSEEDLLGNPDPNSLGRGGAGSGQGINDGTHINVEGGGTGAGQ